MPSLVDDGLHGVFGVCKACVIPLLLTGLKDRLTVSNFISLGQVQAFCLCQFKLCTPQLDLHLDQLLLRHQPGFLSKLHPLLGSLNSFPFSFVVATTTSLRAFFRSASSASSFSLPLRMWANYAAWQRNNDKCEGKGNMHSSKQMERGVESYRYSMPLQSPSQQFLNPIREKLDILMQQEALHQALGNPPPFALGPHPYAGEHGQRLITEFAGNLPPCLGSRGGFHIRLGLGNWLGITSWLPDHDLTRCSEGSLWKRQSGPWAVDRHGVASFWHS